MIMPPLADRPLPAVFGEGWHVVRAAESGDSWHPQVRQLLYYWLRLCTSDGRLPGRDAIDRTVLGDLLPSLWMLDVERDPWRFRYRMAGPQFCRLIGRDIGHDWYDELHPLAWSATRMRLITTVRNGTPTWRRGPMPLEDDAFEIKGWREMENLMLPLACDGTTVDAVLGITLAYQSDQIWTAAEPLAAQ